MMMSQTKPSTWHSVAQDLYPTTQSTLNFCNVVFLSFMSWRKRESRLRIEGQRVSKYGTWEGVEELKLDQLLTLILSDSVDFSPDGTQLAPGAWDSTVKFWNLLNSGTLTLVLTLFGYSSSVTSVKLNPAWTFSRIWIVWQNDTYLERRRRLCSLQNLTNYIF